MEEVKYSVDDFAGQAAKVFGATPEAVRTALRFAGVKEATIEEAKTIVKNFLESEVK